ncbi:MAG: hypothetical protein M8467_01540 [Anaerolineae bacterium]|nr:hypothetical protein [Anaerolineae bacterium]
MEQLLFWTGTALRVLLAGVIALLPGTTVWLTMIGIGLAIRQFARGSLYRRQEQKSAVTPGTLPN